MLFQTKIGYQHKYGPTAPTLALHVAIGGLHHGRAMQHGSLYIKEASNTDNLSVHLIKFTMTFFQHYKLIMIDKQPHLNCFVAK